MKKEIALVLNVMLLTLCIIAFILFVEILVGVL